MPLLPQRRLHCFYCGQKSSQKYRNGLSRWDCEYCLADNYLDAKGEITEPPAAPTPSTSRTSRFAQAVSRPSQVALSSNDQSPFCQTCLNNQHFITQNLANYLPETTDPRYAEFEANLPKYKKELEQRYPPVCADCENVVTKRIRDAGAYAKADYLRRAMEKTRTSGITSKAWSSTTILRVVGGLLWLSATGILVLWNGFGALADYSPIQDEVQQDQIDLNVFRCLGEAGAFGQVHSDCATHLNYLAGLAVCASIATFWWNPVMSRRRIDRVTGLTEFYKLQAILVIARCGMWSVLNDEHQASSDPALIRLVHAVMLAMNAGVSLLAYCTPRIAKTPQITFHDDHQPLVDHQKSGQRTPAPRASKSEIKAITTSTSVSFPFGQTDVQITQNRFTTPMLLSEDELDPADAMEIDSPEPKHNFRPASSRRPQAMFQEASPFYGKIPAAPVSQEHRLRNPPNKPSFQKTSSERQDKFFQSMTQPYSEHSNDDSVASTTEFRMQEPRLVVKQDTEETGLEGWFSSNVFSLGESRIPLPFDQAANTNGTLARPVQARGVVRVIPVISLMGAIAACTAASLNTPWASSLYYCAASIGVIVTLGRFQAVVSRPTINVSDILLCIAELFGATMLAYQTRQAVLNGVEVSEALGTIPFLYFSFMMVQECIIVVVEWREDKTNRTLLEKAAINQSKGIGSGSPSQGREKKILPLDKDGTLSQSYQKNSLSQMHHDSKPDTTMNRSNGMTSQSSNHTGFTGLSLGAAGELSHKSNLGLSSQHTRTLRSRTPNPWEVGGI